MSQIEGKWKEALQDEFKKPYYKELYLKTKHAYETSVVFPKSEDLFNAFHLTPLEKVKVVILGQDPYHEPNQAHGLSFSVKKGVQIPPSLQNIYKEMETDLHIKTPSHGDLTYLASQGVLLLNSLLTVEAHKAFSHQGFGWEEFTDAAIKAVDKEDRPIVFILWGSAARKKKALITNKNRLIIESAHPSPLSSYRGFFGSRPFSRTNEYLVENGVSPIDWEIKE